VSANPPNQYATDRNLVARQRLWSTSRREPTFELFPWILDLAGIGPGGNQRVLDVGCGNGAYEQELRARGHRGLRIAVDLSAGMLPHVRDASKVCADVQALPFIFGGFDTVFAPHMLYHVPNVRAAASETRRVLRPDGLLVAVTNGVSNLIELRTLVEDAVGTGWAMVRPADLRFSLENGADLLSSSFQTVTRVDCPPSQIVVTDIDALADYVASVADHYEAEVEPPWADVVERVRDLAGAALSSEGELRFNTAVGAFVCS
jgi:SAM-dependent methyltransferase